jgi:hypothetical protein
VITTGKTFARVLAVLVLAGLGSVAGATAASAHAAADEVKTVRNPALAGTRFAASATSFAFMRNLSGLCAQPSPADPTGIGVQLTVATCDPNSQAQRWATVLLGGNKYKLVNQATGGCIDANGAYVSGTPVDTWFCGPISNEEWVDGPSSPTFPLFSPVKVAASANLCLAPNGSYGQVGAALVLRPCAGLDFRQYWFIG